jgi:hypothetical protein
LQTGFGLLPDPRIVPVECEAEFLLRTTTCFTKVTSRRQDLVIRRNPITGDYHADR